MLITHWLFVLHQFFYHGWCLVELRGIAFWRALLINEDLLEGHVFDPRAKGNYCEEAVRDGNYAVVEKLDLTHLLKVALLGLGLFMILFLRVRLEPLQHFDDELSVDATYETGFRKLGHVWLHVYQQSSRLTHNDYSINELLVDLSFTFIDTPFHFSAHKTDKLEKMDSYCLKLTFLEKFLFV